MSYYEKYHCVGCPVEKYCGTVVSCTRLCHSYKESEEDSTPILTLSKSE